MLENVLAICIRLKWILFIYTYIINIINFCENVQRYLKIWLETCKLKILN